MASRSEEIEPTPPSSSRAKQRAGSPGRGARWATLAISILLSLALAEAAVRIIAPHRVYTPHAVEDPTLVYRNEPGVVGRQTSPGEFDYRFSTNSRGFRGREFALQKAPGTQRIICVGDSFTWGTGVNDAETYPAVLEEELKASDQHVEVLNAGVRSWGVSQYYVWTRHEGLRYQPDVVVVTLFEEDWENALLGLVTEDEAGQLVEHRQDFPALRKQRLLAEWVPGFRWLMSHSQLANLARDGLRASVTWPPGVGQYVAVDADKTSGDREHSNKRARDLTRRLLLELDTTCREAKCRVVIAWIPTHQALQLALSGTPPEHQHPINRARGEARAMVQKLCEEQGIPFADATVTFVDLCRKEGRSPVSYYFARDGHFRPEGYRILARALAAKVRSGRPQ